jgi:murein DD-endopeptidase MepM/ murein hydrolase activator NlpD
MNGRRLKKPSFIHSADWRRELRTFAAGLGCGFLAGALLVTTFLWQYNWIVPPWASRPTTTAGEPIDPGARGVEREGTSTAERVVPPPASPESVIGPEPSSPTELKSRQLLIPVEGIGADQLTPQFSEKRGGSRMHEAIDILAPHHTPVKAVEDGTIARLFFSKAGGITIYQFDPSSSFCYYYAHLDRYADGLAEGARVQRGQVIGYVGTSGNAPKDTPHLHFAIFRLTDAKRWWEGTPIDPYDVLR